MVKRLSDFWIKLIKVMNVRLAGINEKLSSILTLLVYTVSGLILFVFLKGKVVKIKVHYFKRNINRERSLL